MVKKLLILLLTLTLSLNSFSQTVTKTRDTTHIVLSTRVARMVAVDLVLGDKAREENKLLNEKVNTLNSIIGVQDSLLVVKDREVQAYQEIREIDKTKINNQEASINRLKKDIAKQEKLKRAFQVTTGIAIVVTILQLIRK